MQQQQQQQLKKTFNQPHRTGHMHSGQKKSGKRAKDQKGNEENTYYTVKSLPAINKPTLVVVVAMMVTMMMTKHGNETITRSKSPVPTSK